MSFIPSDPADFSPNMGTYNELKPFRFWCQKVLPLVYDDSLSYYELLCKVVDYLNKTMEDVDTLHTDIDNLNTAYGQLQNYVNANYTALVNYVNDYFDNLDVQEEINNKLDTMAEDGTLDELLLPYFNEYKTDINNIVTTQNDRITVLEGRMDTFSSLTEGSTTGDAELLDIRVGANGITYPSAGDAVRGQYDEIMDLIDEYTNTTEYPNCFNKDDVVEGGYYGTNGSIAENNYYNYSPSYGKVTPSTTYYGRYNNNGVWTDASHMAIAWYDEEKTFISQNYNINPMISPANASFARVSYHTSYANNTLVFADFQASSPQRYGIGYALDSKVEIPQLDDIQKDRLSEKIICCCGDSITYGADMDSDGITDESPITVYQSDNSGNFTQVTSQFRKTWGYQIAERHNMVFYNGGVSGSTMQGIVANNGFSLANGRYTKLPESIDYLLIWFGWNDEAYGTLGTINDSTNDTFYGGYNVVIPYLQNKYPYAKIGLIVPYGSSAGHREAVRLLGNKWGLAVFDNYQGGTPLYFGKEDYVDVESSVVTANRAKFQANGAHPNYKGHTQLADMIEEFVLKM